MPPAVQRFVLHWGDMGDQWGVNRSVAQIHALLYLADKPITAEEIAETLGLARSNVSNSIRELLAWKLIDRVPVLGDRRDHYVAESDIWEMASRIAQGRKEREIDPAMKTLRACVAEASGDRRVSPVALTRLNDMLAFMELIDRWYAQMLAVPAAKLAAVMRMGAKIVNVVGFGRRARAGRDRSAA